MNLDNYREKIDHIDNDLLRLFEERMNIVSEIAAYKKTAGLPVFDPRRETEKQAVISQKSQPETEPFAHILFDTLFEVSRAHQRAAITTSSLKQKISTAMNDTPQMFPERATVACQGVMGAYAQLAATRLFARPDIQYFNTFDSVFSAIESGFCEYGVLPLENSTAGSVNKVYGLLQEHNFHIVRSVRMKIDHNLAVRPGVNISDVREIISHEQALAQCAAFLEKLGPNVKITACENTAAAAEAVAQSDRRDIAAICSHNCLRLYGLEAAARDIQDRSNNYTRFICIAKKLEIYPGADRTSIMMVLPHTPGSLYKALGRFYALGVNISKLESRPLPERDFDFMFYLTLETSVYSDNLLMILDDMQEFCEEFKYLGSYTEVI